MAKHKKTFGALDVLLVETAETAGNLPECFKLLTKWYEFRNHLLRIIRTGLILPFFVLHIAIFVIPLTDLFLTDMTLSQYFLRVLKMFAFLYIFVFILVGGYKLSRRNRSLSQILDIFILWIPILGSL